MGPRAVLARLCCSNPSRRGKLHSKPRSRALHSPARPADRLQAAALTGAAFHWGSGQARIRKASFHFEPGGVSGRGKGKILPDIVKLALQRAVSPQLSPDPTQSQTQNPSVPTQPPVLVPAAGERLGNNPCNPPGAAGQDVPREPAGRSCTSPFALRAGAPIPAKNHTLHRAGTARRHPRPPPQYRLPGPLRRLSTEGHRQDTDTAPPHTDPGPLTQIPAPHTAPGPRPAALPPHPAAAPPLAGAAAWPCPAPTAAAGPELREKPPRPCPCSLAGFLLQNVEYVITLLRKAVLWCLVFVYFQA